MLLFIYKANFKDTSLAYTPLPALKNPTYTLARKPGGDINNYTTLSPPKTRRLFGKLRAKSNQS